MSYKKDYEIRDTHPGWAIRFEDGTWLGGVHGWSRTDNAFDAYIYDSKIEAFKILNHIRTERNEGKYFDLPYEVIEAWQPICEALRSDVAVLKQTNVVSYLDVFDLREELESIVDKVRGWQEKGKQNQSNVNWEGLASLLGCSVDEVKTKLLPLELPSLPESNTNGDFNDH